MLGYPDMGDRCYMMNEQLSRLTPFSQQVAPGLSWRSGHTRTYTDKNSQLAAFGWKNKKAFFISPASLEAQRAQRGLIF
jgi:hypothetical protein